MAEGQRIVPYYPPNRGFMGTPVGEALQPGTLIDRFGSGGGRFVSPAGTPIPARALPPGVADGPYNVFRVVKPFDVRTGPVSPWFGQPGLGIQHELPVSVTDLLRNGYIERVGP